MGRDTWSGDSRLVVVKNSFKKILGEFSFQSDSDRTSEENLIDCLADVALAFVEHDGNGRPVFRVDDGDSDSTYDWNVFEKLAPHLVKGSYYEQVGDDLVVVEFGAGDEITIKVFEHVVDENTGANKRGKLQREYDYYGDDDFEDGDDEEFTCKLLEAEYYLPKANLPEFAGTLGLAKGGSVEDRVIKHLAKKRGWSVTSNDGDTIVFQQDESALDEEVNHKDSINVHDHLSIFLYGAHLGEGSHCRFQISEACDDYVQTLRYAIHRRDDGTAVLDQKVEEDDRMDTTFDCPSPNPRNAKEKPSCTYEAERS